MKVGSWTTAVGTVWARVRKHRGRSVVVVLSTLLVLTVAGAVVSSPSAGTPNTWTGATNTNWSTGTNWSLGHQPTTGETATFTGTVANNPSMDAAATPTLLSGIDMQASFTGTITQNNRTITVGADGWTQAGGNFVGGTVAINVGGNFTLTGGTFSTSTNTFKLLGDFTHSAGGGFVATVGTALFSGATTNTIDASNTPNLATNLTGANNDLLFTSTSSGVGISTTRVAYVVAGLNTTLSVGVSGSDITVNLATDGAGASTSTASQVLSALNGSAAALALVTPALLGGNDGTGIVTALAFTNLATTTFNAVQFGENSSTGGTKNIAANDSLVVNNTMVLMDGTVNQSAIPAAGSIQAKFTGAAIDQRATADGGTAQIVVNGTGAQTIQGVTPNATGLLPKVKIDKSAGNLLLTNMIRTANDWEVATLAGTLTMNGTTPTLNLVGSPQTFTHPSAINKTYTGAITIGDSTTTANVTLPAGTLIRHSGALNLTNGAVNGPGSIDYSGATLTQGATATGGTATLNITGTAAQTLVGNAAGDLPPITVTKTGTLGLTFSGTVRTTKNVTITSLGSTGGLTVAGIVLAGATQTLSAPAVQPQTWTNVQLGDAGVPTALTLSNPITVSGTLTLRDGNYTGTVNSTGGIVQHQDYDGATGTLNIVGAGAQSFVGNATATAGNLPSTVAINNVGGTLTLSTPAGTDRIRTSGAWTYTAGTVDPGTSKFVSAGATFSGTQTLNDLEIRGATTVTGNSTLTTGALTFTSGVLTAASGNLVSATGAVTRPGTGHVNGSLQRAVAAGTSTNLYPIGNVNYAPVTITATGVVGSGVTTATTATGDHADIANSGVAATKSVNRTWTLSTTATGGTRSVTFGWDAADVDNTATPANFIVAKEDAGTWTRPAVANPTATSIDATGLTSYSTFQVGEPAAPSVTGVSSAKPNGTYGTGTVIDVDVTFSESVTVNPGGGTPFITLETGTTDRNATYLSGSPGTTLTFRYTVQAGDTSGDLDYTTTTALSANGGTIQNGGGTTAVLTLPAPGAAGSLGANKALVVDATGPTSVSLATPPGQGGNGFIKDGSTVAIATGSPTDPSGVASVEFRACSGNGGCVFDTAPISLGTDSVGGDGFSKTWPAGQADGTYTIVARATDNSSPANTTDSSTVTVTLDNTRPTVTGVSLQSQSPAIASFASGSTVWYHGAEACAAETQVTAKCSFKVRAAVSDTGGSSPASATFTSVSQGSLTLAASTSTTPGAGVYDSNFLSWSAGETDATTSVTGTDGAGNTSLAATTVTFKNDSTAATTAMQCDGGTCAGTYVGATDITLVATDAGTGSGVTRNVAGAGQIRYTTNGDTPTTSSTLYTGTINWTTTGTTSFKFRSWDNVGNVENVATVTVEVTSDATAPAIDSIGLTGGTGAGSFKVGDLVYYRGAAAGSTKLRVTVTDTDSGPASISTTAVAAGTFLHTADTAQTAPGTGSSTQKLYDSNAYSWTAAAADQTSNVKAKDVAGNETGATTITFRDDSTPPPAFSISSPAAAAKLKNGATLAATPTADAASGLAQVEWFYCAGSACTPTISIGADTTPTVGAYSVTWSSQPADGTYTLHAVASDNVGNTRTSATVQVTVDNTPPTSNLAVTESSAKIFWDDATDRLYFNSTALAAPAAFTLETAAADPTAGVQQVQFPNIFGETGDTDVTATGPWASSYTIESGATAPATQNVVVTDQAGNATNDALDFTLDTGAPTSVALATPGLSLPSPPGTPNAKVKIGSPLATSGTPADAASGIASVTFVACPGTTGCTAGDGDAIVIGTDTTNPYTSAVTDLGATEGTYELAIRATDNVGNTTDSTPVTVTFDKTAPTTAIDVATNAPGDQADKRTKIVSTGANAYTLYLSRATAATPYAFRLTSAQTDATSGPGDVLFPAVTATGVTNAQNTDTLSPFSSSDVTVADNAGQPAAVAIVSRDAAGNATTDTVTFVLDTSAPAPAPLFDAVGPANSGVVKNGATLGLSNTPLDPESTVTQVEFFYCTGGACDPFTGTSIGVDVTAPYSLAWSGQPADGAYRIGARATNQAGLTSDTAAQAVTVDNSAPTDAQSLASATGAVMSGSTIYYRGSTAGQFVARSVVTDTNPASATFTAGTGFTQTSNPFTSTSPGAGTYDSNAISWAANTTAASTLTVTSTDAAGNVVGPTSYTLTNDSTAPTPDATKCGGVACDAGAWYATAQSVTLAATDAGSGGVTIRYTTDGSTPSGSSALYTGAIIVGDGQTTVKWIATDAVGNPSPVQSQLVRVDTTGPGAPTLVFSSPTNVTVSGNTVTFNGNTGGSFTVTASATDAGSGIASYTFPALGSGWSATGSGASRTYTFTGSAVDPAEPLTVRATNGSGLFADNTALTVGEDAGNPTVGITCNAAPCAGTYTGASIAIVITGADASGVGQIRYTTNGVDPTPTTGTVVNAATASFTISAQGLTSVRAIAIDAVGNVSSVASSNVQHDSLGPALTSSALSGTNAVALTFSETLVAAPAPGNGAFTIEVDGAPRAVTGVSISGSVVTVTFGGAPVDDELVEFSYTQPIGDALRDGSGNLVGSIALTRVGATGAPPAPPAVPSTPELLATPSSPTRNQSATFGFAATAATGYECSVDGSAFTACANPATVSGLGHGGHSFAVRGIGPGGTGPASSFSWVVDITGPTLTKGGGPSGLTVDAGPSFAWSSTEGGTFVCRMDGGAASGCESPKGVSGLSLGDHTFEVWGLDALGNAGPAIGWTFKVIAPSVQNSNGSATPIAEEATKPGTGGILFSPDRSASLEWPALPFDGLLMTLAEPTTTLQPVPGMGLAQLVDANAVRISNGEKVTDFGSTVLRIVLGPSAGPVALYTSSDNGLTWEPVPYFEGDPLPATLRHGARIENGIVVIYTRHLSLWASVADAVAPSAPAVTGTLGADGLTLGWQPSSDNSGRIARYVLYVNGAAAGSFDGSAVSAKLGAFGPEDARSLQLAAEDGAGNRSPLSTALRSVPSLAGLTLAEARASLEARGLTVGAVTEQDSAQPAGSVVAQTPAAPAIATPGQTVDLVVARAGVGGAKFVLKVAAAKTLPLKIRRTINVRIQVTRRANVAIFLRNPRGVRLYTWKRHIPAGASILPLRLPAAVKRSGVYTLGVWAAGIGERERFIKRIKIRVVGAGAGKLGPEATPPRSAVEVVLAGGDPNTLKLNSRMRLTQVRTVAAVFDRALATRAIDVLIVDVATEGLALVRDFHKVYPDVAIVAIAPRSVAARARAYGASLVVVRGASLAPALRSLLG
jgi:hypothetical protein